MADEKELTEDEIIAQVDSAFSPHFCAVQVEFRASLWCEVFDKNREGRSQIFTIHKLGGYRTPATLAEILQGWRVILENDGYEFDSG